MFDATKGQKVVTDQVDDASDAFAALFDELPPRQQLVVIEKMNGLLGDETSLSAFTAGTYAQSSAGQPATQLGAGTTPTPNDLQQALDVIMRAPGASDGQKAAMTRIFFGGPDHMPVETDGTPTELVSTRTERDNAKTAKDVAERKLSEERDPNKVDSLQHKLDAALAAHATPADAVNKADVVNFLKEVRDETKAIKAPMGVKVTGKKAVVDKIDHELSEPWLS